MILKIDLCHNHQRIKRILFTLSLIIFLLTTFLICNLINPFLFYILSFGLLIAGWVCHQLEIRYAEQLEVEKLREQTRNVDENGVKIFGHIPPIEDKTYYRTFNEPIQGDFYLRPSGYDFYSEYAIRYFKTKCLKCGKTNCSPFFPSCPMKEAAQTCTLCTRCKRGFHAFNQCQIHEAETFW